jgi:hypothetical protein
MALRLLSIAIPSGASLEPSFESGNRNGKCSLATLREMDSTTPKAEICPEKQRLTSSYLVAIEEVTRLEAAQVKVLASGGDGLDRFELALKAARRNRARAKRFLAEHLREHLC